MLYKNLVAYPCKLLLTLFSSIVPKSRRLWVFGAWHGKKFSDNPKYLFIYASKNLPDIKAVWITKSETLANSIRQQGYSAYYYLSVRGIFFQLRCGVVFVSHSLHSDITRPFIGWQVKRIQLWHGTPLKKIGFDDTIFTTKGSVKIKASRWYRWLNNERYDFYVASGDYSVECFKSAFNVSRKNILDIGYPRNDVFLRQACDSLNREFRVIYMPTFRGSVGSESEILSKYGFEPEVLNETLRENKIILVLRLHPVNMPTRAMLDVISELSNIEFDDSDDIYESISGYDCLISDYSSIIFDFEKTGRPIILAPFDLDLYLSQERHFYMPYEDFCQGKPVCFSWEQIAHLLVSIKKERRRIKMLNTTNKEMSSCELICQKLMEL